MEKQEEKWALFWCDLLRPVIFEEIEPEGINRFLKNLAGEEVVFPDGRRGKPSLSSLRRKLNRFNSGGFDALCRRPRGDRGRARKTPPEVIAKAIELKTEQPYRSDRVINRFLKERFDTVIPSATLYRHLKQAGATRIKLGISKTKIRKRIVTRYTHELWVGDFEEGPYVIVNGEVLPTYLCAFIDHHSRFMVDARYYLRQNLDILIDSWLRALGVHGAPFLLYVDNAKVYHAIGLRIACYRLKIRLRHRPPGEPETGGVIERFFETVQSQFEREVRAGEILPLQTLNRTFSAWLTMAYHNEVHSEIGQAPEARRIQGLQGIRQVDITEVMAAFMERVERTVNRTFCDVQLNKRFYRCDPKSRGDRVQVRFDPFSNVNEVEIYSRDGQYLHKGYLHKRETAPPGGPLKKPEKPQNSYLDLLVRQHDRQLEQETRGIDYRKETESKRRSFHQFVNVLADLLGLKGGLTAFNAEELEKLKKTFNQHRDLDKHAVKAAFERAAIKEIHFVLHELKLLLIQKETL
jgi:putative transposase